MRCPPIPQSEAAAVSKRVDRLLKDLSNPAPPIDLANVRALLKLDLRYYSLDSPALLDRMEHKLRVAGKILTNFDLLKQAVTSMSLKAFLVPSSKRILIDDEMHRIKKRWAEAHEITHELLDWHHDFLFGDSQFELSPGCQEEMESEANFGAGRILYPAYFFDDFVAGREISIATANALASQTGNSITSACWRLAEQSSKPAFLIVSEKGVVKHLVPSRSFDARFSTADANALIKVIRGQTRFYGHGPLGTFTSPIQDDEGSPHEFVFDAFSNSHSVLTLAVATA